MVDSPRGRIHDVAAVGFDTEAEAYERSRPSYPPEAVSWLVDRMEIAPGRRVVRPGGRLALIWNARDRSVEWVDLVWSVMDRVENDAPWRIRLDRTFGGSQRRAEDELVSGGPWTAFLRASFAHAHRVTAAQVVERIRSVGHVAALPALRRTEVLEEVETILREHPDTRNERVLSMPYRVDAMITRRR